METLFQVNAVSIGFDGFITFLVNTYFIRGFNTTVPAKLFLLVKFLFFGLAPPPPPLRLVFKAEGSTAFLKSDYNTSSK